MRLGRLAHGIIYLQLQLVGFKVHALQHVVDLGRFPAEILLFKEKSGQDTYTLLQRNP